MKATESQKTHAVCHTIFLYAMTGIQAWKGPCLRFLHFLDGLIKCRKLSILNGLLVCSMCVGGQKTPTVLNVINMKNLHISDMQHLSHNYRLFVFARNFRLSKWLLFL